MRMSAFKNRFPSSMTFPATLWMPRVALESMSAMIIVLSGLRRIPALAATNRATLNPVDRSGTPLSLIHISEPTRPY